MLHRFWDIAIYWSEIADFNLPNLFLAPRSLASDLWRHTIAYIRGLSYGVVFVVLRLAILVQYRRVTDGRTDRHAMTANTAPVASRG